MAFMLRMFMKVCKMQDGKDLDDLAISPMTYDPTNIACPSCKAKAAMDEHSSYWRHFIYLKDNVVTDIRINIKRLRCSSCGKTHAALPEALIPYLPFSICFVARLIIDWLDKEFSSIEALCKHYQIAINTFYRLRARFERSVLLAYDVLAGRAKIRSTAQILSCRDIQTADELLNGFFILTKRSFCQPYDP
jgi:transposase